MSTNFEEGGEGTEEQASVNSPPTSDIGQNDAHQSQEQSEDVLPIDHEQVSTTENHTFSSSPANIEKPNEDSSEDGSLRLKTHFVGDEENRSSLHETTSLPNQVFKSPSSMEDVKKRTQEDALKHGESFDVARNKRLTFSGLRTPRFQSARKLGEANDDDNGNNSAANFKVSSKLWRMASMSGLSSRNLRTQELNEDVINEEEETHQDEIYKKTENDDEETASQVAKRKMEQRLRQAKKIEKFFVKSDIPPRPVLVKTKYDARDWKFDANNDWLGRCSNPNFFRLKKPFFAAFHLAWFSFFVCFMGWFAVGPIVPLLLKSGFSKEDIEFSNALALASTIIIRFILGPLCEVYGAKLVMTWTLGVGGILVCSTSAVTNGSGLMAARFFIGLIGGAFVPCQFWITMMFSTKIVGFMGGSAAGFGNAGAGVIVFLMGGLIAGFQSAGYSADQTWRYSLLIPGFLMIVTAIPTYCIPSDCPQGEWKDRKYGTPADKIGRMAWLHRGGSKQMQTVLRLEQRMNRTKWLIMKTFYRVELFFRTEERFMAFWDWKAWMVGIQYSIASGVELSILTGLTTFYTFEFGCDGDADLQWETRQLILNDSINSTESCLALDNSTAAYIAAIFGLTNLYGRMIGGGLSDYLASTKGIFRGVRGRHFAIFITILGQGVLMMIWSGLTDWQSSAGFLVLFSSVVHCSKGAVIAIAPFVSPGCVGPVMGVVSAVGNIGGVLMSLMYTAFRTSREVYYWQGLLCIVGSITAAMLRVHDLELNKGVWLLSRPQQPLEFEDFADEGEEQGKLKAARLKSRLGARYSTTRWLWEKGNAAKQQGEQLDIVEEESPFGEDDDLHQSPRQIAVQSPGHDHRIDPVTTQSIIDVSTVVESTMEETADEGISFSPAVLEEFATNSDFGSNARNQSGFRDLALV